MQLLNGHSDSSVTSRQFFHLHRSLLQVEENNIRTLRRKSLRQTKWLTQRSCLLGRTETERRHCHFRDLRKNCWSPIRRMTGNWEGGSETSRTLLNTIAHLKKKDAATLLLNSEQTVETYVEAGLHKWIRHFVDARGNFYTSVTLPTVK